MYNPMNMNNIQKVVAGAALIGGLIGIVNAGDTAPLHPGTLNTQTYKNEKGEIIACIDLTGKWGTYYSNWEIVDVKQSNCKFIGTKTKGNAYIGAGAETIKGHIEGDNIYCQIFDSNIGWQFEYSHKMDPSGKLFKCQSPQGTKKFELQE